VPEFLRLPLEEQGDILTTLSAKMGRSAQILQKDAWVCWVLEQLFAIPSGVRMAFKGGTSLSKVFGVIHRFSEDVDVTLDYRDICGDMPDPVGSALSRSQQKQAGDRLKERARARVLEVIVPPVAQSFLSITNGVGRVELSEDGERFYLHYPSPISSGAAYMGDWILVEFGGRNVTEPSGLHSLTPDIAAELPDLHFPISNVTVLSPERTFWEKATLIHVECHRQRKTNVDRLSRHWYDLAMLCRSGIGENALANRELLLDVVRHKSVFFDASYANYDACLAGAFRLVPDEPLSAELRDDYRQMIAAGMFDVPPPDFEEILNLLNSLEHSING